MTTWKEADLQRLLRARFSGTRLIVVSNREPFIHAKVGDRIECTQPASGLALALDPVLRAVNGTWIAHGSGSADRLVVDPRGRVAVPPSKPSYTLRRVWLDSRTEREYYCGLSNEGLWPLCHIAFQRPTFRLGDWAGYRRANRLFADAVLEEANGDPAVVFIQDYHFALLPRMLKQGNPSLTVAQFWHIPWPNRETFRVFPWREELLDGMLGNDLLGFHLRHHCANFLETIDRGVEAMVDTEHSSVRRNGQTTLVRPFPISIDFDRHSAAACGADVELHMENWRNKLRPWPRFVGLGIDRIDYTKGIPDRLRAMDCLLERYPGFRGNFVFIQVAVPSRTEIEQYRALNLEVENLVAELNRKWGTGSWKPVLYVKQQLGQRELMALHRLADVCVVSSLHDGMNLVAKEFVASRTDGDGVLVLSSFAGASRELTSALTVNPFSPDQVADAIARGLTMPQPERKARMRRMAEVVRERNIYRWAGEIFSTLSGIESSVEAQSPRVMAAGRGTPVS